MTPEDLSATAQEHAATTYTQASSSEWSILPNEDAEALIYDTIHAWDVATTLSPTQIGMMCRDVNERCLWRFRADPRAGHMCKNFTAWMRVAAPRGYSTAHQYMREVTEYLHDIPDEDLKDVLHENVDTLRQLSTKVRNQTEILDAAKVERADVFVETVRAKCPEQHISRRVPRKFFFEDPEFVDAAIEEAIDEHGAMDKGHAIEMFAAMAKQVWQMEKAVEESHAGKDTEGA